ncbi:hypothetical protein QBC46DRAFT_370958 [Diplogelasinospora grovesii]|uniref:Uncharacterized protein n=1 Tax=Diplogelasinospora grovesii TaxID=303347 RepID=A0AAN6NGV7_9PEZI|nr:hypothetical protein QBC46DRAFT_370958 [Diplogelasinospora grovesii]
MDALLMDELSVFSTVVTVVSILTGASRFKFWTEFYGSQGIILYIFGNIHVLHLELEVLLSNSEDIIMGFKKSAQDESSMIAIAGKCEVLKLMGYGLERQY